MNCYGNQMRSNRPRSLFNLMRIGLQEG
uniref:Uncharacterized protein n=1 Tax=Anguilla anguilla TaxID=7936 RepID=A0A0E9S069_ANGAN